MNTSGSRQDVSMPFMQIRYVKCTERIPGLMVAIAGLLTSLWTNCVLVVVCTQDSSYFFQKNEMYISKTIIHTSQITHLTIVLTCTAGLLWGLKEKNRTVIPPWLVIKVLELVSLFIGCIMLGTGAQNYIGLMPVAIIFLLIGGYISLCVWDTYRKMDVTNIEDDLDIPSEATSPEPPKDPPSYDFISPANFRSLH